MRVWVGGWVGVREREREVKEFIQPYSFIFLILGGLFVSLSRYSIPLGSSLVHIDILLESNENLHRCESQRRRRLVMYR